MNQLRICSRKSFAPNGLKQYYINGTSKRFVSRQCWDNYGFRRDGTDLYRRTACNLPIMRHRILFRIGFFSALFGPMSFMLYMHGVFDYIFRRRKIRPLEPNWDQEQPLKPPDGYENPLFEPGRRYAKIRLERRKKLNEKRIARGLDPL